MRVVLSLAVVAAGAPVVLTPAVAAAGIELPVSGATANKLSDGGEASLARTAVSGDDVYVVWQDRTISPTGVADIAFRHSPDRGAAFGGVSNLSRTYLQDSRHPEVSASGDDVYVVWQQVSSPSEPEQREEIWFTSSQDRGASFAAPQRLDSGTASGIDPVLVSDGDRVVVGWTASDATVQVASSSDEGRTFTPATAVGSGQWEAARPALAVQGEDVLAVWSTNSDAGVESARSSDGGAHFSEPATVATGDRLAPVVAMDEAGVAVAAWFSREGTAGGGSDGTVETSTSTDRGAGWGKPVPLGPALLDRVDIAQSQGVFMVAARQRSSSGSGVAVWSSFAGGAFSQQGFYPGVKEADLAAALSTPTDDPVARFAWTAKDRYGVDADGDGIIDQSHEPDYLDPTSFHLSFDACRSTSGSRIVSWTWRIDGGKVATRQDCAFGYDFAAQGTYDVSLEVTDTAGRSARTHHQVDVRDLLVVSIGDSVASGEGNPEIPDATAPVWTDRRCHRSTLAGPSQAAIRLEQADPATSVTFLSVACSGASVLGADDDHGGLVTPYNGIESTGKNQPPLPSQLDQLRRLLRRPDGTYRRIDALLVSIGANDVHFSDVLTACLNVANTSCYSGGNLDAFDQRLATLPDHYEALRAGLTGLVDPQNVYITEYFDPTHDSYGAWDLDCVLGWLSPIDRDEARWAGTYVVPELNSAVRAAAEKNGWHYVTGITSSFDRHGYCAGTPWIVQIGESKQAQHDLNGSFHPNAPGHRSYGQAISDAVRAAGGAGANAGSGPASSVDSLGDLYLALYNSSGTVESIAYSLGGSSVVAHAPVVVAREVTWAGGSLDVAASDRMAFSVWTDLTAPQSVNTSFQSFGGQAALPPPNLQVVETEAVQNVDHPSSLVAGKSTTIRARVRNDLGAAQNVFVRWRTESELSGGGSRPTSEELTVRLPVGESWLDLPADTPYVVPADADSFTATVALDPQDVVRESDEDDNTASVRDEVVSSRVLKVLYLPAGGAGSTAPCADVTGTATAAGDFVTATFPVADADARHVPSCEARVEVDADRQGVDDALSTLDAMARSAGYDAAVGVVPAGWLRQATGDDAAGLALLGSADLAGAPAAGALVEAGADPSVTAHELGHLFGLEHDPGVEAPGYWPSKHRAEVKSVDFMDPQVQQRPWVGQQTESTLLTRLQLTPGDPAVIGLSGTIAPDGTVQAPAWYRYQGLQDVSLGASGELTLDYLDASGAVLGSAGFTPSAVAAVASSGAQSAGAELSVASGYRSFSARVPDVDGTARLVLRRGDTVLVDRTVSAGAPQVTLTSPADGTSIEPGQQVTVGWEQSDPDGDTLTAQVEASTDSGQTWVPLARGLTGTSYEFTATRTLQSDHVRFRVVVSDGVNTGSATSATDLRVSAPSANGRIAFTHSVYAPLGEDTPDETWVMNADGSDQHYVRPGYSGHWDPAGGWLVTPGRGVQHLYNVDDGSTKDVPLLPLPHNGSLCAYSPDGTRVLFAGDSPTNQYRRALFTMAPDGSDETMFADLSAVRCGTWSPDGSRIVYPEYADFMMGTEQLVSVAPDGSDRRVLSDPKVSISAPEWTPDGQQMLVSVNADKHFMLNPDGTGWREIRPPYGYFRSADLSPDGRRILATFWNSGYTSMIATMATDGTDFQVLTQDDPDDPNHFRKDTFPSWEPLRVDAPKPPPPAAPADAGGPYAAAQGEDVVLDASATARTDGQVPEFSWDLDGDGTYGDASGAVVTTGFLGAGTHRVGLQVTRTDGSTATDEATVMVTDVAPALRAPEHLVGAAGLPVGLSGATVGDPGSETPTVAVDWGDGSGPQAAHLGPLVDGRRAVLAEHTYGEAGSYTVSVTASDGVEEAEPATVTVEVGADAWPVVAAVAPTQVASSGGTVVRLLGSRLATTRTVTVGGVPAVVAVRADTTIDVTMPAGGPGTADLVVTTDGGSTTSSVTYADLPVPLAAEVQGETEVDAPVVLRLSASVPPGSGPLRFAAVDDPAHGTVELVGADLLRYTPTPGFVGTDSFHYAAGSAIGTGAPALVTVRVGDREPTAGADAATARAHAPVEVTAEQLLANDADADGDPLTVVGAYLHEGSGTLAFDAGSGAVTFTGTAAGTAVVDYLVSDGRAGPVTGRLQLTVTAPGRGGGGDDQGGDDQGGGHQGGGHPGGGQNGEGSPPAGRPGGAGSGQGKGEADLPGADAGRGSGDVVSSGSGLPSTGAAVSAVAGLSALLLLTGAALMAAGRRRRRTG